MFQIMDTPGRFKGPLPPQLRGMPRVHSSKYRRHQGARERARRVRQAEQLAIKRFLKT